MSLSRSLLTRLLALAVSVAVPALANADDEMPTADASNVPALVVRAQSQAKQAEPPSTTLEGEGPAQGGSKTLIIGAVVVVIVVIVVVVMMGS